MDNDSKLDLILLNQDKILSKFSTLEPKNIDIAKFIGQGALINGCQDGDTVTTALGKLTLKNNFMSLKLQK